LSPVNLTMIYLAGVVFVATRTPMGPSAFCSVAAALLFDYLFTPPRFSFAISDTQYLIVCGALLTTALVISGLTQRVRRQSEAARERYLRTIALYFMSRQLAASADADSMCQFAARHIADVFAGDAVLLLPDDHGGLRVAARHGSFSTEEKNERA